MVVASNTCMRVLIGIILILIPAAVEPANRNSDLKPIERAEDLIAANRPYDAMSALLAYKPADQELSAYHFAYAKALEGSKRPYDATEHYRLAYVYSSQENKESILLRRAEVYLKMGYYPEAALLFRIFMMDFPNSAYKERAHFGLANSFYGQGRFNAAVEEYDKADRSYQVLYSKANALNSSGNIKEAYNIYMSLAGRDNGYLISSVETQYNFGENLRLMGKFNDARVYLNSIQDATLKYKATLSLGLIEIGEAKFNSAIKYFRSALQSPDRLLRRKALLHIAETYLKIGKQEDAKLKLSEIRDNYPYGKDYDKALLMLAGMYKKEGKFKEAVSLLNELVFTRSPNRDALDEFEAMLIDTKDRNGAEFLMLWKSVGQWLLEPSRSQSLLKIADGLRNSGRPFFDVCSWLFKYGSEDAKKQVGIILARHYADLGDVENASTYLRGADKKVTDDVLRVRARIHMLNKEYNGALDALALLKDIKREDIVLLSDLVKSTKDTRRTVALYEKAIDKAGAPAVAYIVLADTLFDMDRKQEALKYYKAAVSGHADNAISPDDRGWVNYRISLLSQGRESVDALRQAQPADDTLGRFTRTVIKEENILAKIKQAL